MLDCVVEKAGKDAFLDASIYDTLRSLQAQIDALKNNQGVSVEVSGRVCGLSGAIIVDDESSEYYFCPVVVPFRGKLKKIAQSMLIASGTITIRKYSTTTGSGTFTISAGKNNKVINTDISVEAGDALVVELVEYQASTLSEIKERGIDPVEEYILQGMENLFNQTGTQPKALPSAKDKMARGNFTLSDYPAITFYIEAETETIVIAGQNR